MAVEGKGYTKTTWSYGERPVASSKLNSWDDNIESAIALLQNVLAQAWGGGDGVIRGATEEDLKVEATAPPSLAVVVSTGFAFISQFIYKLSTETTTSEVTPPSSNPRIDIVEANLTDWTVSIVAGEESGDPEPPSGSDDSITLAQLHLRPGMTCIKDTDDESNGYITDVRQFL